MFSGESKGNIRKKQVKTKSRQFLQRHKSLITRKIFCFTKRKLFTFRFWLIKFSSIAMFAFQLQNSIFFSIPQKFSSEMSKVIFQEIAFDYNRHFSINEFAIFKKKETFYSVKLNFVRSNIHHICRQTKLSQILLIGRNL